MEGKQKVALTFALYQNDELVRRETVTQDIVKVGKDAKSHLRVDDELASRMHAVIEVASPDDITLIDLGNEPGTMVNGARVNKCKISPGDQLQIGGTKIDRSRWSDAAIDDNPFFCPDPGMVDEWTTLLDRTRKPRLVGIRPYLSALPYDEVGHMGCLPILNRLWGRFVGTV